MNSFARARTALRLFVLTIAVAALVPGCFAPFQRGRIGAYIPPGSPSQYVTQASWYLDPANSTGTALDTNDCATSTTPCRTAAEIMRRWGTNPRFVQDVSMYVLSDMVSTDQLRFEQQYEAFATMYVYGGPNSTLGSGATSVQTGTFSSVTNLVASRRQLCWS